MEANPLKILVIRFSSLGDLVLLTPLLKAVREGLPRSEIHLACKEQYAEIFKEDRNVDQVFTIRSSGAADMIRLIWRLRKERYDTIIDAHNVPRSNLLYRVLRARRKVQLRKDQVKKTLLIKKKRNLFDDVTYQTARYLDLAARLGIPVPEAVTALTIPREAAEKAEAIIAGLDGRELIAIAPGARWETKRWPLELYRELASELAESGHGVILLGSAEDVESADALTGHGESSILNLAGTCSILETAAIIKRCGVLVTNDSAPLHIAEAVGTPVVAIFGPTVKEFGYFPHLPESRALEVALDCRPCSRNGSRPCPPRTKECLTSIPPERIIEAVHAVLEERKRTSSRGTARNGEGG